MSRFITSAFLAFATFSATFAAEAQSPRALTVSFADLDMARPADALTLLSRIEKVARDWCIAPGHFRAQTTSSCTRKVMADVVGRLNAPVVTAAWLDRGGERTRLASR